jgi:hypothetical protein
MLFFHSHCDFEFNNFRRAYNLRNWCFCRVPRSRGTTTTLDRIFFPFVRTCIVWNCTKFTNMRKYMYSMQKNVNTSKWACQQGPVAERWVSNLLVRCFGLSETQSAYAQHRLVTSCFPDIDVIDSEATSANKLWWYTLQKWPSAQTWVSQLSLAFNLVAIG